MTQYQLLPSLDQEEYQALKADIQARGVQVPVEFDEHGNILDGHHRLMACKELGIKDYPSIVRLGMDEREKRMHVYRLNLLRRHLNDEQRILVNGKLRYEEGMTQQEIADLHGISRRTVERDLEKYSTCANAQVDNLRTVGKDGKSRPSVYNKNAKDQKRTQKAFDLIGESLETVIETAPKGMDSKNLLDIAIRTQKEQTREEASKAWDGSHDDNALVWLGDFRHALDAVGDNTVDLIFTDPPYDSESVPLYGDMAQIAARILKPGGSLIAYCGHHAIGDVYNLMAQHLRYWWLIAVEHGGNSARLEGKKVYVGWKPLLWFVKGSRGNREYVSDIYKSAQPDKELHDWQQDTSEADYYIRLLTDPGGLVVDPFCGSGTTLIAALNAYRSSIGIEIDIERANVAKQRIGNFSRSRTA